ncbi:hypothetical protein HPP92_023376 [Vanilla planifolia]|uniref:Uncharacterized protein n=1 Tax=Vanilla planifolia TaxID=51239 RepID=A0A835Q068_VANPL|nr:hypothetical protein HPP92_023615 [Vanilla planifolia]KAG0460248.1 hypothetical protein HPP92_023376 [Vanilla planifolia]
MSAWRKNDASFQPEFGAAKGERLRIALLLEMGLGHLRTANRAQATISSLLLAIRPGKFLRKTQWWCGRWTWESSARELENGSRCKWGRMYQIQGMQFRCSRKCSRNHGWPFIAVDADAVK